MSSIHPTITISIVQKIMYSNTLSTLFRLLQLSDSALPIGGFTFSNTLESAISEGVVCGQESLQEYCTTLLHTFATTDGIAALNAYRASSRGDFAKVKEIDAQLTARKTAYEQRQMSSRMGRKLAQLAEQLLGEPLPVDYNRGEQNENYAVVMATLFWLCHLEERHLFTTLCYNTLCTTLQAALRLMRISHHTTQRILFDMGPMIDPLYEQVRSFSVEQMHTFSPQTDILAWRHEQSRQRLFMN